MRVLLINSNRKADVLIAPPIGLCYVAGAAERAGHDVRVLDLCFSGDYNRDVRDALRRENPDVVGVSIRNLDNANLLYPVSYLDVPADVVRLAREHGRAMVVLGGSGVSLCPEAVFRRLRPDYVVAGDGEGAFADLLACLAGGGEPLDVPGVGFARNGVFALNPCAARRAVPGTNDAGRWIDTRAYDAAGASYTVQTRRGCRFQCIYCTYNTSLEGYRLRLREPGDVVDEIEAAQRTSRPRLFEFADSVFNDPPEHCRALLEEIVRRGIRARFTAMGVLPLGLDRETLDLMWRAGFRSFMMSPESASEAMLENYRKGFRGADVHAAADALSGTEFSVFWYFMLGGPGESPATIRETLAFVRDRLHAAGGRPRHVAHLALGVRVYPNTVLWTTAVQEGFFPADADPLDSLWYVSNSVDIGQAVDDLVGSARSLSGVVTGLDESWYGKPHRLLRMFLRTVGRGTPAWLYGRTLNTVTRRLGIRTWIRPENVHRRLCRRLAAQGYTGPHLERAAAAKAL